MALSKTTRDHDEIRRWARPHARRSQAPRRQRAEDIRHLAQPELDRLKQRFFIEAADLKPRSFMRITDNWIEFSARFLCRTHDVRALKDTISREIMDGLDAAGIGIASGTYNIVGFPPIRIEQMPPQPPTAPPPH